MKYDYDHDYRDCNDNSYVVAVVVEEVVEVVVEEEEEKVES
jgi:hypothetical protein